MVKNTGQKQDLRSWRVLVLKQVASLRSARQAHAGGAKRADKSMKHRGGEVRR